jgi:hypothetical protein
VDFIPEKKDNKDINKNEVFLSWLEPMCLFSGQSQVTPLPGKSYNAGYPSHPTHGHSQCITDSRGRGKGLGSTAPCDWPSFSHICISGPVSLRPLFSMSEKER